MTDANVIFAATQSILREHDLPSDEMFGLATDGASVMTGVNKGVATQYFSHQISLIDVKTRNSPRKCVHIMQNEFSFLMISSRH